MTHCQDDVDETWHALGSQWRNSKCMDCTCSQCCSAYVQISQHYNVQIRRKCNCVGKYSIATLICRYSTPKSFPDDCVAVFDAKECEYIVHKKDDPTVPCPIFSAVGK